MNAPDRYERFVVPEGTKNLTCLCSPHQIQTTSQSSPTQAYNQVIDDLDKELDYLKKGFEVCCSPLHVV
ncbi:hypothetical protein B296_00007993 [Ensete ventricosum]|uniref:Uncharacterized protein n=1 Tax=Ensete ventricosum TaxID=4639 RepID=A0A427AJ19_ENSVE|nr:hypothetical protein B296_00007993 [Ensete ventricosum]